MTPAMSQPGSFLCSRVMVVYTHVRGGRARSTVWSFTSTRGGQGCPLSSRVIEPCTKDDAGPFHRRGHTAGRVTLVGTISYGNVAV